MPLVIVAILLGIVEGITEFLPISSTGHLILFNEFFGFSGAADVASNFNVIFNVVIQLGAILAVVIFFWKRLVPFGASKPIEEKRSIWLLWGKTILAIVPAAIVAFGPKLLFGIDIEEILMRAPIVAAALVVGGIVILLVDGKKRKVRFETVADIGWNTALLIGLIQCLAIIPGTSRSAATIIGALLLGCSRVAAAEFSFFLAIPTLVAASGYELVKNHVSFSGSEILYLALGFIAAFVVAFVVIKSFMGFIQKRDFKPFGWYRIGLGLVVIVYFLAIGRI